MKINKKLQPILMKPGETYIKTANLYLELKF